ncbi:unnamed protein product [Xylocopa violacea]|uniref:Uncharacterized protein n=1 Tax=Xylocopa violacea TaxID=135666 RepID=A0ABP1NY20_XYLVO
MKIKLQQRPHRPYCRKNLTIDLRRENEWTSTIQTTPKNSFHPVSSVSFVDNQLYFDPNTLFRITTSGMDPRSLENAIRLFRIMHRHHHHHHYHHHHHHHRHTHRHRHHHRHTKHRRTASDPGTRNWSDINQRVKRHRRMFSYDTGITGLRLIEDTSIAESEKEVSSPGETKTSTFRKVPWHPNLHMLKIRTT